MGNLSITLTDTIVFGNRKMAWGTIGGSTSYETNGDSYTPGDFKMQSVERIICNHPVTVNFFDPDEANNKIKAYDASATEITATTDIATTIAKFIAIGK